MLSMPAEYTQTNGQQMKPKPAEVNKHSSNMQIRFWKEKKKKKNQGVFSVS